MLMTTALDIPSSLRGPQHSELSTEADLAWHAQAVKHHAGHQQQASPAPFGSSQTQSAFGQPPALQLSGSGQGIFGRPSGSSTAFGAPSSGAARIVFGSQQQQQQDQPKASVFGGTGAAHGTCLKPVVRRACCLLLFLESDTRLL